MNGEMEHIKEFVKQHLEPCYWETAEEMMLINPFCGVVKKFIDEFKAEEKMIEKEKEAIKLKYSNPDDELLKLYDIRRVIEQYFNVDIDRKTNKREIAYARQMAMYFARKLTRLTLSDIGSRIASRNHTTVLHSINVIESLKRYPETEKHISELNKIFNIKECEADL